MTEISRPFNGNAVLGDDGPYSDEQWHDLLRALAGNDDAASSNKAGNNRGVIKGALNELRVQEQSTPDATVRVRSGYANAHGVYYYNDGDSTQTPSANASGSTRYDIIILRVDYTANECRLAIVEGTPAAGLPALTQSAGATWEIPLAALELANGFATITDDNIIDMRRWANAGDGTFVWVQNNSAAVMEGGDVAVWDSANDSSVTSTTTPGAPIAGIVEGRLEVNEWGRVQRSGIAWVNLSDDVARGDFLSQGETALQAGNYGGSVFGHALAAGSADEQALAVLDVRDRYEWREGDFKFTARAPDDGWAYADGTTIGNSSSGADFADDRALSLFYELWMDYLDAELPILTSAGGASTRGASATVDWAANKRMTLPDMRGRVPAARDNQGGSAAGVVTNAQADLTGGTMGEEEHTLVTAEMPAHTHTVARGTGAGTGALLTAAAVDTIATSSAGSDDPHNNMQPTLFAYWQIKL